MMNWRRGGGIQWLSAIVQVFFLSFLKGVWLQFGDSYKTNYLFLYISFFLAYEFTYGTNHNSTFCE